MTGVSRFPSPPLEEDLPLDNPRMRRWLQTVWEAINSQRMQFPAAAPTLPVSPAVFQYVGAGLAEVFLAGGTVSLVEFSRNNSTFYKAGTSTDRGYLVNQGDYLRITYTVAPNVTIVPR